MTSPKLYVTDNEVRCRLFIRQYFAPSPETRRKIYPPRPQDEQDQELERKIVAVNKAFAGYVCSRARKIPC
jgi:hypothetical protein